MVDLKKVITGLEWCMNEKHDCYEESGCPYENECEGVGCKYALHRDAISLLKAHEPTEPEIEVAKMDFKNVYSIITNLTKQVIENKVEVQIDIAPDNIQIGIQPWEPYELKCPYGYKNEKTNEV